MAVKWKKIKGYRNYSINDKGVIKNSKGLIRKSRLDKAGYPIIDLKQDGKRKTVRVHQLTAMHFVAGKTKIKHEINHKLGNKLDTSAKSLEYVSPSENSQHSRDMGLYGRYTSNVKQHTRKKKNGVSVVKTHKRKNNNGKI